MTRTGRVAINTVSNYLRFGTMFLVFMFMTPIMIRGFGTQDYGIWTLVFSVTGFFGLFDLGFGTASVKFIAQLSGSGERDRQDRLMGTLMASYLVLALLSGLAALAISPFLDSILGLSGDRAAKARFLYWILVFRSAILYLPLSLFRHILYGRQKIWLVNAIQAISTAAYGIGTVIVIRAGGGILEVAWVNFAAMLFEHILYIVPVLASKERPRIVPSLANRGEFKNVTSVSMYSFLVNLIVLVQMRTDPFIINAIVADPLRAVAIYSIATKICEYYLLLIKQFGNSVSPLVAELKGRGEDSKIRFLLTAGTKYAYLPATLIGVFLVAAAKPLLIAWVGPDFVGAALPLIITVCAIMLTVPEMMASTVLTMTGHHKMTGRAAVLAMVLNVGFSIVFVRMMGFAGAALGTLVACIIVDVGIIIPKVLKLYRIGVPEFLVRILPSVVVPGLADFIITRMILTFTHPGNLVSLGIAALPGAAACLAIFWFLFIDSAEKELFIKASRRGGRRDSSGSGESLKEGSSSKTQDSFGIAIHWLKDESDWETSVGAEMPDTDMPGTKIRDPFACWSYQYAVWKHILGKPPALLLDFQTPMAANPGGSSGGSSEGAFAKVNENASAGFHDEAFFVISKEARKIGTFHTVRTIDYHVTSLDLYCLSRENGKPAWDALLESRGEIGFETGASLMCLYKLADASASVLEGKLAARKIPYSKQLFNRNFHILLPSAIEEYWKSKSPKALYNIRRSERLLSEASGNPVRMLRFGPDDLKLPGGVAALATFLGLLRQWAEDRAAAGANYSAEAVIAYRRDVLNAWADGECMELYALFSGERLLAGQVNVFRTDRIVVSMMGYDKEYSRFSPGRILFRNFLSNSHECGVRLIELGGEGEEWKKEWATHDEPVWSITFPIGGWMDTVWSLKQKLQSLSARHGKLPGVQKPVQMSGNADPVLEPGGGSGFEP
ncbi:MAG: GNAT family N-acetyltransferase [Rectinemataceae bacterium]|nr:GNAT family N-acetyltransferase [Rectinemataceae bacterium]